MSWDFEVLKTNLACFRTESFEAFCKAKGYTISMHPDTNLKEDSGFMPFRIAGDFLSELNGNGYISGFELYSEPSKTAVGSSSKGLLKGVFGKKSQPVAANSEADKHDLVLICGDQLEIFLAHLFGSYFLESQGCLCYDPQDDIEYVTQSQIEKTIMEIHNEIKLQFSSGKLELHIFQSWS